MLTFILKSGSHRKCNMFSEFNTVFCIDVSIGFKSKILISNFFLLLLQILHLQSVYGPLVPPCLEKHPRGRPDAL